MGTGASNQVRGDSASDEVKQNGIDSNSIANDCSNSISTSTVVLKKTSTNEHKLNVEKNKTKEKDKVKATRTLPSPKTFKPVQTTSSSKKAAITSNSKSSVVSLPKEDDQHEELTAKIKLLETELANSESLYLDAADQIQILEEKLENAHHAKENVEDNNLVETINAKDQYILKLEKDLKAFQSEANTSRLKLKRRVKHLTNQLHETRQDASISQMELKSEITLLQERLKDRKVDGHILNTENSSDDGGHSKVIVELSNQMSEQNERIHLLEAQLAEKDSLIMALEEKSDQKAPNANDQYESNLPTPSGDRLRSGRGSRTNKSSVAISNSKSCVPKNNDMLDESLSRPSFSRMSTALSDSDSDWELDDSRPQTRSAPARVRVKSAASTQSKRSVARQAGVTPEDDSIMQYFSPDPIETSVQVRDAKTSEGRTHPHNSNRSSLKKHLDKQKQEAEIGSLLGPSVAFALPQEMPSSCEPTPRYGDPRGLPGFSKLTVINTIHQ